MGGYDDENNLVKLTPREHFIAHKLLEIITRGTYSNSYMLKALHFMSVNYKHISSRDYSTIREKYLSRCSAIQREVLGKPRDIFPLDKKYFKDSKPITPTSKWLRIRAREIRIRLKLRGNNIGLLEDVLCLYIFLNFCGYKGVKVVRGGIYRTQAEKLEKQGVTCNGYFQEIVTEVEFPDNMSVPIHHFNSMFDHSFPRSFKMPFLESRINVDEPLKLVIVKKSKTKGCVELFPVNNWLRIENPLVEYFYRPLKESEYLLVLRLIKETEAL